MFLKELLEGTTVAGDYPQADICEVMVVPIVQPAPA